MAFFVDPQLIVRGILVNGRGQRYVADDTYPARIGQLTLYQQDDTAFLVLDAEAHEQAMASHRRRRPFCCGRRPGSARALPSWKPRWVCRPARCKPPSRPTTTALRAVRIRCCTRSRNGCAISAPQWAPSTCAATTGGFTLGGLHTSLSAEVLQRRRRADPRSVRGRAGHGRPRRLGICQRYLVGRRQLLRTPGRTGRRELPNRPSPRGHALCVSLFSCSCDGRHTVLSIGIYLLVIAEAGGTMTSPGRRLYSERRHRSHFTGPGRL